MSRCTAYLVSIHLLAAFSTILPIEVATAEETRSAPAGATWEARIETALETEFSFKGTDVPLKDFANQVSERADITVLLDDRSLDDVGIRVDVPLTCDLKGISLRNVLRHVLKPLELSYVLCDGALMITTPEDAGGRLLTRFYDVSDLAESLPPTGSGRSDCDELIDVITANVAPTCWDTVGGPGTIAACRGRLTISQTLDVHERIGKMLSMIRKAKRLSRTYGTETPRMVCVGAYEDDPVFQRIQESLQRTISVDFARDSLARVADELSDLANVNVELDIPALDDVGIGTNAPVTFRARNMRLDFVLRHILRELDLTFAIRHQVVLITTPEECERELATRVYPIGDLLGPILGRDFFGDPIRLATVDELTRAITAAVVWNNWSRTGGPGSIMRYSNKDFLIVTDAEYVHEEIVQALTRSRASLVDTQGKAAADTPAKEADEPTRLVVYFVRTLFCERQDHTPLNNDEEPMALRGTESPLTHDQSEMPASTRSSRDETQRLLEVVTDLIESVDGSARDDAYARSLPGRLVIRHTDHVHRQIERLLRELRIREDDVQWYP